MIVGGTLIAKVFMNSLLIKMIISKKEACIISGIPASGNLINNY